MDKVRPPVPEFKGKISTLSKTLQLCRVQKFEVNKFTHEKSGKMLIQQKELSDLVVCSYHNWYEDYKKNCIKSFCLQINQDVLNYLKQDLFILPKECNLSNTAASSSNTKTIGESSSFSDDDEEPSVVPEFKEFSDKIVDIIDKLGN